MRTVLANSIMDGVAELNKKQVATNRQEREELEKNNKNVTSHRNVICLCICYGVRGSVGGCTGVKCINSTEEPV